jgi:hypothetical protein
MPLDADELLRDRNLLGATTPPRRLPAQAMRLNRWRIPESLEREVRQRDAACIYCGVMMLERPGADGSRKAVATWEHIVNDASIVTIENIARCCASCNSSKGTKRLSVWIPSTYCTRRGITPDSVADVVKAALRSDV